MSHVLHDIEKQIVKLLQSTPNLTEEQLAQETKLSMDQIRRGVEWLRQKDLANVTDTTNLSYGLGKNGLDALKNGLPERRLVNLVKDGPKTFDEVQSSLQGPDFNAAIGYAKKNDWINIEKTDIGSKISLKGNLSSDTPAVLIYTSGTTGLPKGVMLSHQNVIAGGRNTVLAHEIAPNDVSFCVLPLYHINAEMVSISSALVSNSCVVIVSKFSVSNFWQILEKYQCTWFSVVPTIINYLLNDNCDVSKLNLSSIRFGRSASAPLSPEVHKKFEQVFKVNIVETMGLTETAAQILSNPLDRRKHGSAGIAYGNEVRVVNDQGNFIEPGESGELVIKGDNVMKQYYNNEEATKSSFTKDGYFLTGDLGVEDEDGFFFITGRKKELIIKGGENISPREIDDTIYKHNSVLEVCTFGIFDENYGEEISACVFLKDNFKANEKELKDLCIADLGEYKTPSQIIFVDEPLPKGPSGKIQRLKIAEQFKQA